MDLGPHTAFIVAAYAAAGIIITALVAWVLLDHRAQRRKLTDLEERGMRRRSNAAKPASP